MLSRTQWPGRSSVEQSVLAFTMILSGVVTAAELSVRCHSDLSSSLLSISMSNFPSLVRAGGIIKGSLQEMEYNFNGQAGLGSRSCIPRDHCRSSSLNVYHLLRLILLPETTVG